MLRYTVNMPPKPPIEDLATREVTITLDSNPPDVRSLQPDTATFQFDCERNVNVQIWLVDIDSSGNRSAQSPTLSFVATDTIPPPVPGQLSVATVEQVDVPPPATPSGAQLPKKKK
jgi:hypothetical protein